MRIARRFYVVTAEMKDGRTAIYPHTNKREAEKQERTLLAGEWVRSTAIVRYRLDGTRKP